MADTPRLPALIRKQLRTSHVKDLPPMKPHGDFVLAIRLPQAWPDLILARVHL